MRYAAESGVSLLGAEQPAHVKLPVQSIQRFETEAKKAIVELGELANTQGKAEVGPFASK